MLTKALPRSDEQRLRKMWLREEKLPALRRQLEEVMRRQRQAAGYAREWREDAGKENEYGPAVCQDFSRAAAEWEERAKWGAGEVARLEREIADIRDELRQ